MERRKNKRVPFSADAVLKGNGKEFKGVVTNMSMKGVLVEAHLDDDMKGLLDVEIILTGSSSKLSINLRGKIVRKSETEIALEFKEIDLDSFIHLKNVVSYNSSDADDIMTEYYQSLVEVAVTRH